MEGAFNGLSEFQNGGHWKTKIYAFYMSHKSFRVTWMMFAAFKVILLYVIFYYFYYIQIHQPKMKYITTYQDIIYSNLEIKK